MTALITRLKTAFSNSRFANPESVFRHVSLIAGGTVIAQTVGILTMPIISRIYSPSDYGIMAIYTSVIAILQVPSGFLYHLAIPFPKNERYAKALIVLSLGLQILFVSILALLLFVAGKFLLARLAMSELIPYRPLIPLGLLITGVYIMLTQWAIREKFFTTIARTKITQSLSGAVTKIVLGLLGIRPLGLLIGTIVAQGGGIITLLRSLLKKGGIPHPEKGDIRRAALQYRKFPMYSTWSALLNTLGGKLIPLLLVSFYNPEIAGLFAMAQALLYLPSVFIGQAIGQVFLQRACVAKHSGGIQSLSFRAYLVLLRLGFFPLLFISFFSPILFAVILGDRWIEAGAYAKVLGPLIAFGFAYSPMSRLYSILNRQGIALFIEIAQIIIITFAFLLGVHFNNSLLSVGLFANIAFLISLFRMIELLAASGTPVKDSVFMTLRIICEAFLLMIPPIFIGYLGIGLYILLASILLSFSIFLFQCYKHILKKP